MVQSLYLYVFSCKITFFVLLTLKYKKTNDSLADRLAAFGPRIDDVIIGQLSAPLNDVYGCSPINNNSIENWIPILERGRCSFLKKVQAMQESGAIAVVVGDKSFNGWVTMYAPGNHDTISHKTKYL